MTSEAHAPGQAPVITDRPARSRRTVRGPQSASLARVANGAALDFPAWQASVREVATAGTYSFSYSPAANPQNRYLRIQWYIAASTSTTRTASVDLSITDNLGNNITSASAHIPRGFKADVRGAPYGGGADRFAESASIAVGYLDVYALTTAGLAGTDWSLDFVVAITNTYILSIEAWEVPRGLIDTAESHAVGVLPRAFLAEQAITSSATSGDTRLLATVADLERG